MNLNQVVDKLVRHEEIPYKGIYSFINPYSLKRLIDLEVDLVEVDGFYVDGFLLAFLLRKSLGVSLQRTSFDNTSLAPRLFSRTAKEKQSIYFVGGTEKEIRSFVKRTKDVYPSLKIVGYSSGFANVMGDESITSILKSKPDIIVAGLGTPLQERFLMKLKSRGWNGLGLTCGGFITQASRRYNYFPNWSERLHLRWLIRLVREPHVFKRIVFIYPPSLWSTFWALRKLRSKQNFQDDRS